MLLPTPPNFAFNRLDELSSLTRSGTRTVLGAASEPKGGYTSWGVPAGVTNVTVSGTGLSNRPSYLHSENKSTIMKPSGVKPFNAVFCRADSVTT
jgi:hypothetical protein